MAQSFFARQGLKWFGGNIVRAAFRGILGRQPDKASLRQHVQALGEHGQLRTVLETIARSPEAWQRNVHSQPRELARQLYLGLYGTAPEDADLAPYVELLEGSRDIPRVVAVMTVDRRRKLGLLEVAATSVVDATFLALLQRLPEEKVRREYGTYVAESGDLRAFIADVGGSQEHLEKAVATADSGEPALRGLYAALLGRAPLPAELAAQAPKVARESGFAEVVTTLIDTPDFRERFMSRPFVAGFLVEAAYRGLLGRNPDAGPARNYQSALEQGEALSELLAAIDASPEHWSAQIARNAEAIVKVVFQALLHREPGREALQLYSQQLARTRDLHALISVLAGSRDRR